MSLATIRVPDVLMAAFFVEYAPLYVSLLRILMKLSAFPTGTLRVPEARPQDVALF
jgi:hypothetical protein